MLKAGSPGWSVLSGSDERTGCTGRPRLPLERTPPGAGWVSTAWTLSPNTHSTPLKHTHTQKQFQLCVTNRKEKLTEASTYWSAIAFRPVSLKTTTNSMFARATLCNLTPRTNAALTAVQVQPRIYRYIER